MREAWRLGAGGLPSVFSNKKKMTIKAHLGSLRWDLEPARSEGLFPTSPIRQGEGNVCALAWVESSHVHLDSPA